MKVFVTEEIVRQEPCLCSLSKGFICEVSVETCNENCRVRRENSSGVRIIFKKSLHNGSAYQQCMSPKLFRYFLQKGNIKIIKD
jgi:hypothetical protein